MKNNIILAIVLIMAATHLSACQKTDKIQNEMSASSLADSLGDTGSNDSATGWEISINTIDLYGTEITNEDFLQNDLTILNVWATWCPSCIKELPELQKISETFAEQGVQVVGVLQDGVTEFGVPNERIIQNALKLLDDANADYKVILPDETLVTEFISAMRFFPTTFFINREGTVIHTVVGAKNFDDWSDEINEALKQIS